MTTDDKSKLSSYLKVWEQVQSEEISSKAGFDQKEKKHLSDQVLAQLADNEGMESALPEDIEHLSLCPQCLNNYIAWRKAITVVEELEDGEQETEKSESSVCTFSYGFLKAAASEGPLEPIQVESECGNFTLKIFPAKTHPEKGLIVLESGEIDECSATVRDARGTVLITGILRKGSVSRQFSGDLSRIDISTWTVSVKISEI